jgi:heptosyltransferase I
MRGERGNPHLRAADRLLGIPVVAAAGLVRRRRARPDAIGRIAALNSTNIGDTVLLSAVLRDLAHALPETEVVLFAGSRNASIARLIDGIRVVPISLSSPVAAVRAVRAERPDVILDFDPWPRIEAIYSLLSGARFAVGFRTAGQHRHYCYDASPEHVPTLHELDNYRLIVEPLGVRSTSLPELRAPGLVSPDRLPTAPYAVLHLWPSGFRGELKEWPESRWRALAEELAGRGLSILLTGGPDDRERSAAFARTLGGTVVDATGAFALDELLDVLAGAACIVSVNTGVMHMAAAVGAPTVGLNGPTSELRWGPLGRNAVSVNSELPGCGYLDLGWEYRGRREDCMQGIPVEAVLTAVEHVTGAETAVR